MPVAAEAGRDSALVGVVGFPKAGKSETARFLRSQYGFDVLRPSSVVRAALVADCGEDRLFARSEYRAMALRLRHERGPGYYLDDVFMGAIGSRRLLIDGPRHLDTTRLIRQQGGFIIGLVARPEVCYTRALEQGDKLQLDSQAAFVQEGLPEMNSLRGEGQLLPILWETDPRDIIDTSDMQNLQELGAAVGACMARYGVLPLADSPS